MAVPIPPDPYLPSVDDIGALLRARTQDNTDQEVGTFTPDTRPTDDQVTRLIAQAANVVFASTGPLDDLACSGADKIIQASNYLISLLAAMLVELSYYPEQVRSDRSAFQGYFDIFTGNLTGMPALIDAVAECKGGEIEPDQPGSADGYKKPVWAFPVDEGGLIGWQTRW